MRKIRSSFGITIIALLGATTGLGAQSPAKAHTTAGATRARASHRRPQQLPLFRDGRPRISLGLVLEPRRLSCGPDATCGRAQMPTRTVARASSGLWLAELAPRPCAASAGRISLVLRLGTARTTHSRTTLARCEDPARVAYAMGKPRACGARRYLGILVGRELTGGGRRATLTVVSLPKHVREHVRAEPRIEGSVELEGRGRSGVETREWSGDVFLLPNCRLETVLLDGKTGDHATLPMPVTQWRAASGEVPRCARTGRTETTCGGTVWVAYVCRGLPPGRPYLDAARPERRRRTAMPHACVPTALMLFGGANAGRMDAMLVGALLRAPRILTAGHAGSRAAMTAIGHAGATRGNGHK